MLEALLRVAWFFAAATLAAYATYLGVGSAIKTQDSGSTAPIIIRDALSKGEHHLSGIIMVPSNCDELSVRVDQIRNDLFSLVFATWSEPSIQCVREHSARVFNVTVFAPSVGVQFIASLDGVSIPVAMYPSVVKKQ